MVESIVALSNSAYTSSIIMLSVKVPNVEFFVVVVIVIKVNVVFYCFGECRHAKGHYAESRVAKLTPIHQS